MLVLLIGSTIYNTPLPKHFTNLFFLHIILHLAAPNKAFCWLYFLLCLTYFANPSCSTALLISQVHFHDWHINNWPLFTQKQWSRVPLYRNCLLKSSATQDTNFSTKTWVGALYTDKLFIWTLTLQANFVILTSTYYRLSTQCFIHIWEVIGIIFLNESFSSLFFLVTQDKEHLLC